MAKKVNLAVIIPTLNEEKYIGILLDSIASQTVLPKEIVVVDAESKDKTISEIKKRQKFLPQLKYYQIPKYSISRQRNFGVAKTKMQSILFLDADMMLKNPQSLEQYLEGVNLKMADFAISTIRPLSKKRLDNFLYFLLNMVPKVCKPLKYYATSMNFFIKRQVFNKVGGFDENIIIAEDFEFVNRLEKSKLKFVILDKPEIYNSVRRLEKEGRIRWNFILLMSLFFVLTVGYKKNPIVKKYGLGNH